LNGDAFDASTEKKMIDIPVQRNSCCHTGGGMEFDAKGDLFITVGNNTTNPGANAPDAYLKESDADADDQGHTANTNDLRGKVLRIKPKPDGTYDIPDGNLFAKGTDKAKPEIWAMGIRNPYSLTVDRYRGWAGWGDVGPDDGLDYSEEWNLYTHAVNAGWPYFTGPNKVWRAAFTKDPAAPANTSPNNTGLKTLPPATPATIGYHQSCAVAGPFFYYDGSNPSTSMLPPHLDRKWLVSDWWKGQLEAVQLSEDGSAVVSRTQVMPPGTFNGPLDFKIGPDGALYVVEYGQTSGGLWFAANGSTVISRVDFTGTCHPATPRPPTVALARPDRRAPIPFTGNLWPGGPREIAMPANAKGLRLSDLRGAIVWEFRPLGNIPATVTVPAGIGGAGLLRVRFLD
jgi:cytochrome c